MKNKELHGRCSYINPDGGIFIGYYNNGWDAPGNFINIYDDGRVYVAEGYMKDGKISHRGTTYYTDDTIGSSDYDAPAIGFFENLNTEFDDYKDDLVLEDTE